MAPCSSSTDPSGTAGFQPTFCRAAPRSNVVIVPSRRTWAVMTSGSVTWPRQAGKMPAVPAGQRPAIPDVAYLSAARELASYSKDLQTPTSDPTGTAGFQPACPGAGWN